MTTEELVSVIVPVYNIEDYLPRCLSCIEKQSYRNLEIILVDDGSTDGSGRICDEFAAKDSRVRVIHQPNTGCWAARNAGQDAATGEYLWFPDGDDYFHKDIIRVTVEVINRTNAAGDKYDVALFGYEQTSRFDSDSLDGGMFSVKEYSDSRELNQEELITNLFNRSLSYGLMWNKLFRKRIINEIRSNNYQRTQDWDFCFRAFLKVNTAIELDKTLYFWYQHSKSVTHRDDHHNLFTECRIRMIYQNFIDLPLVNKPYGKLLLFSLYKMIVSYEEELFGDEHRNEVIHQYRPVIQDTWHAYLQCREIPITERFSRLFMARFPFLSHSLMMFRRLVPRSSIWKKPPWAGGN